METFNETSTEGSNLTNTLIYCENVTITTEETPVLSDEEADFDAFLYIIFVLSFYSLSMVFLMIKYIRREEEEMSLNLYYTEFVKRDDFDTPARKNRHLMEVNKHVLDKVRKKLLCSNALRQPSILELSLLQETQV